MGLDHQSMNLVLHLEVMHEKLSTVVEMGRRGMNINLVYRRCLAGAEDIAHLCCCPYLAAVWLDVYRCSALI